MTIKIKRILLVFVFFVQLTSFACFAQEKVGPNVKIINNPKPTKTEVKKKQIKTPQKFESKKETTTQEEKEEANIYLNFENAKLSSVVNYMAEQKKINIIPRKDLDNITVTLTTREPLTLERAWNVLLTLLEMNNFTIIDVDGLYRIVTKAENPKEPLPCYSSGTGTEPEDLPDSDFVVRYIYFLKNIKAANVLNILNTMLGGNIQINTDLDACIITEKCFNIKAAMKIVKELDLGGLRESIKVIQLKYTDAQDVARLFGEISPPDAQKGNIRFITPSSKKSAAYFSSDTKIIPESRNNTLILLGTEKNLDRIIDFIYKYIDVPITAAESRLHIKEIKYAKAEALQPLLMNIIKPPAEAGKKVTVGEYKFFEDVIIAADTGGADNKGGGNRLVIACNQDDWKRLEEFIDKIDKPQPQVAFEVMIVDVSVKTNDELWAQFDPRVKKLTSAGVNVQFRTAQDQEDSDTIKVVTTNADRQIIRTNLSFGKGLTLWGIVQAIVGKNNFSIITQPFIIANNNQECEINATETRRTEGEFEQNKYTSEAIRKQVTIDAVTKVVLTPKINLNGIVDLSITVDITAFQATAVSNPNKDTRNLVTRINIGSGEVLVLGGLTKSKLTEAHYKVPILGDIPLIGNLFRSKSKAKEKSNLYIFIRPSIIKPRFEGVPDEYTQLKLDYTKYQILGVDTYAKEKDPIQRWFFKPSDQTIKHKLADAREGVFRPIDQYTYGFKQPKSVDIRRDPYFRVQEAVKKEKKKEQKEKEKTTPSQTKKRKLKRRK